MVESLGKNPVQSAEAKCERRYTPPRKIRRYHDRAVEYLRQVGSATTTQIARDLQWSRVATYSRLTKMELDGRVTKELDGRSHAGFQTAIWRLK